MIDQEWKGSQEETTRLYSKVRAQRQQVLAAQYERLRPFLDERGRRLWAVNEAIGFGKGGVRAETEALGMSPVTIIAGKRELQNDEARQTTPVEGRQRRPGGGRKRSRISERPTC